MAATPTDRPETEEIESISAASSDPTSRVAGLETGGTDLEGLLSDFMPLIERALSSACEFGSGCPDRLGEAIRYAVLAPGKRLRPALVLMSAEACGGRLSQALPGAVAVELIHAYSLIHDDLPAMDDDDLRRGRPTVHIQFDEATAILAGDALQPLAFAHLCRNVPDVQRLVQAIEILAMAAGPEQLVGGQADDLAAEAGRLPGHLVSPVTEGMDTIETVAEVVALSHPSFNALGVNAQDEPRRNALRMPSDQDRIKFLESIHRRKTGALFTASMRLGAVLSGASDLQMRALTAYSADVGLAFQVVDDLLDFTADETQLGKRTGKDIDRGKLTYPGLMGIDQARRLAGDLIRSAKQHVTVFGPAALRLRQLADFILARSY